MDNLKTNQFETVLKAPAVMQRLCFDLLMAELQQTLSSSRIERQMFHKQAPQTLPHFRPAASLIFYHIGIHFQ